MRPYSRVITGVALPFSCIQDDDLLNIAVAIPVVDGPVWDVVFDGIKHFRQQQSRASIVGTPLYVATSIGCMLLGRGYQIQVEGKVEVTIALSEEIVTDGTIEGRFCQVLLVEDAGP